MSIEHDQSTRKAMRAGITGENVLPPLDEFSVTHVASEIETKRMIAHLILKPLILENYRLRAAGLLPDEMYWADHLAMSWGYMWDAL